MSYKSLLQKTKLKIQHLNSLFKICRIVAHKATFRGLKSKFGGDIRFQLLEPGTLNIKGLRYKVTTMKKSHNCKTQTQLARCEVTIVKF